MVGLPKHGITMYPSYQAIKICSLRQAMPFTIAASFYEHALRTKVHAWFIKKAMQKNLHGLL
jgi:hypothetical protein